MTNVTNGDFETGDLTGWTDDGFSSGDATQSTTVTTGAKYAGTYGCRMYVTRTSAGMAHAAFSQVISTDFDILRFKTACPALDLAGGEMHHIAVTLSYLTETEEPAEVKVAYNTDMEVFAYEETVISKGDIDLAGGHWDTTTTLRFDLYITGAPA